jgi:hypothetical protein
MTSRRNLSDRSLSSRRLANRAVGPLPGGSPCVSARRRTQHQHSNRARARRHAGLHRLLLDEDLVEEVLPVSGHVAARGAQVLARGQRARRVTRAVQVTLPDRRHLPSMVDSLRLLESGVYERSLSDYSLLATSREPQPLTVPHLRTWRIGGAGQGVGRCADRCAPRAARIWRRPSGAFDGPGDRLRSDTNSASCAVAR